MLLFSEFHFPAPGEALRHRSHELGDEHRLDGGAREQRAEQLSTLCVDRVEARSLPFDLRGGEVEGQVAPVTRLEPVDPRDGRGLLGQALDDLPVLRDR